MNVSEFLHVYYGKKMFKNMIAKTTLDDRLCLTLLTKDKSLDLQVDTIGERDILFNGFSELIVRLQEEREEVSGRQDQYDPVIMEEGRPGIVDSKSTKKKKASGGSKAAASNEEAASTVPTGAADKGAQSTKMNRKASFKDSKPTGKEITEKSTTSAASAKSEKKPAAKKK
jgi:hypothetical protein